MHIASCDAPPKQRAGRIRAGLALAYKYGRSVFLCPLDMPNRLGMLALAVTH